MLIDFHCRDYLVRSWEDILKMVALGVCLIKSIFLHSVWPRMPLFAFNPVVKSIFLDKPCNLSNQPTMLSGKKRSNRYKN
jgi:hypothetical protein